MTKKNVCWEGYEPVKGKKPYSKGSCRKVGGFKVSGLTVGVFCQLMAIAKNYPTFVNWYNWTVGIAEQIMDEEEQLEASGATPERLIEDGWFSAKMEDLFDDANASFNNNFPNYKNYLNTTITTYIYGNTELMKQVVDYCKANKGKLPPDFKEPSN